MSIKTLRPQIESFKPYEPGPREWGQELIVAETEDYLTKMLFMKAGTMGGLQYHAKKDETFYLFEGRAWVEYESEPGLLTRVHMAKGEAFHIPPGAVHRVEAITDCVFVEGSTPVFEDRVHVEHEFGQEQTGGLPSTG